MLLPGRWHTMIYKNLLWISCCQSIFICLVNSFLSNIQIRFKNTSTTEEQNAQLDLGVGKLFMEIEILVLILAKNSKKSMLI